MKRTVATAFAALFLAACGSSGAGNAIVSPSTHTLSSLNPADLVRKAGATLPAGSVIGEVDSGGFRISSGTFPGSQEMIEVSTFTGPVASDPTFGTYSVPGDSYYIRGNGFIAELTGEVVFASGTVVFPVTPEVVAKRLGATVAPTARCTAPAQAGCRHH